MSNDDERRAKIIAAQAAREQAVTRTQPPKRSPRTNWAASPAIPPSKRFARKPPRP